MGTDYMIHNGKYGLASLEDYQKYKDVFDIEGWTPIIVDGSKHRKFLEENHKWDKYRQFLPDAKYNRIQSVIDKVSMYDENDERRIELEKILDELIKLGAKCE